MKTYLILQCWDSNRGILDKIKPLKFQKSNLTQRLMNFIFIWHKIDNKVYQLYTLQYIFILDNFCTGKWCKVSILLIWHFIMNIDELRDSIANLIDLADEREISLGQIQNIFRENNLSARNFSGLKTKLNGIYSSDTLTKLQSRLRDFINNHIIFDDKFITLVKNISLDDFEQKLSMKFDKIRYPYTIYQVTKISSNKKLYQFATIREINVREALSVENLREDISDDYQELIGIKKNQITLL